MYKPRHKKQHTLLDNKIFRGAFVALVTLLMTKMIGIILSLYTNINSFNILTIEIILVIGIILTTINSIYLSNTNYKISNDRIRKVIERYQIEVERANQGYNLVL